MNYGILYRESCIYISYSDAVWAVDVYSRNLTSGYFLLISTGPFTWLSKWQEYVTLFTAEAEYIALALLWSVYGLECSLLNLKVH